MSKRELILKIQASLYRCDLITLQAIYETVTKLVDEPKSRKFFGFIGELF